MATDDIKRLYFYERQFLRTRDFQDEQAYHIEMRRRHLIAHHIWGIVVGLEITQDTNSKVWSVQPGMAVDAFGREIIVFDLEPLDTNEIAAQLAGQSTPAFLKVWIAYKTEKSNRPAPGYEVCNDENQFMRVRETFRLIYQNDPPIDLQKVSDPKDPDAQNPDSPKTWPHAFQDLPDDPGQARWPVYLGTLTWDTDPNNPSQKIIKSVTSKTDEDPKDKKRRRYIGVVAEEIEAPNNKLLIRGRGNSSPLPNDTTKPDYEGVPVELEGSLQIDRRLNVLDSAGIGIGKLNVKPDTKLQVSGGKDASLENSTGYVVIGSVDGKNIVMDDHAIMARNNKAKSELQLQVKGGDLMVHKDQAGSEFIVTDSGSVGIGTMTPGFKLDVAERMRVRQGETPSAGIWFFQKIANNDQAFVGMAKDNQVGFYGNTGASWGLVMDTGNGNVGIGTTNPGQKLDVAGAAHASSFPTSSDSRFKTNVKQLTNVLGKLEKIRGVSFEWNELYESLGRSTGHREVGVIAQEVETVFPELITTWGNENYKAIDYGRLAAVLVEAVKELKSENEALKKRIEVLEKTIVLKEKKEESRQKRGGPKARQPKDEPNMTD